MRLDEKQVVEDEQGGINRANHVDSGVGIDYLVALRVFEGGEEIRTFH